MSLFTKKILFSTILITLLSISLSLAGDNKYFLEILFSLMISLINVIVGYYLVSLFINKPDPEFYTYVYGGMLFRMGFVFVFSIYLIKAHLVLMVPYMLFLILFYTIHQWIEISSWLKILPIKKTSLNSQ